MPRHLLFLFSISFLLFSFLPLLANPLQAQPTTPDSTQILPTLEATRALLDEFKTRREIEYKADKVSSRGDSILLQGHAVVTHKGTVLEAGEMIYRQQQNHIEARALIDSSGNPIGLPILKRQDDILRGNRILYDLENGEGTILEGRIAYKKGYYAGDHIRAVSQKEFHVHQGIYTTCSNEDPHFDFYSPRIKVLPGEMAIARPVYLRVKEKRLLWIPFFIFSLRENRQSGLLTPNFGRRSTRFGSGLNEWEVRNLGYYFAPNEYWDVNLAGDLRQRSGWLGRMQLNYARRYHWSGQIETQLEHRTDANQLKWRTNLRHNQELGAGANLRASGTFQSNKSFNQDNSSGLSDRLDRTLRSNLTYNKRWRASGRSLSVNARHTKNLDTGTFDTILPDISLRTTRKPIWGKTQKKTAGKKTAGITSKPWYSRVFYDGSIRLRDSNRGTASDTTHTTQGDLTLRLSSQLKPFAWLNLNPSLSETWQDRNLRQSTDRFEAVRRDRFTANTTVTQTFYGLFQPQLGPITALRHVLKPSIGLNYQAAHSDTGGMGFSGRDSGWDQSRKIALRLDNTFWAKITRGEEESKVRLAQLNLSSGYDFERDRRPLSDLVTRLTVNAGRRFNTRLNLTSEFYDDNDALRTRPRLKGFQVNSSLRFSGRRQAGTDSSATDPFSTRSPRSSQSNDFGSGFNAASGASRSGFSSGSNSYGSSGLDDFGFTSSLQRDIGQRGNQWTFLLTHFFDRTRTTTRSSTRSWLRTAFGFSLRAWRLDYSLNYNLRAPGQALIAQDRITSELCSLRRHFHDWSATINIEPNTFHKTRAFFFKVQFNDIPQIKFERGDSRL